MEIAVGSSLRETAGAVSALRSSPRERIEAALETRLIRTWPFEANAHADLLLDGGKELTYTIWARGKRVFVSRGSTGTPTARVSADPQTLADVLDGVRSGAAAWLEGDLRVRGSIALAMKLEGLLRQEGRPRHFPRPMMVHAHGIDTFCLEAGDGPPVVLLHGLGATNASFLPTLRDLARDHRVIAPDLPGFGESSKPLRAYHAGFFAKWLRALLDVLKLDKVRLVGNSMGGRIAIEAGLRFPERIERLAVLAPAVAFRKLRQLVPLVKILRPELGAMPMIVPRASVLRVTEQLFARRSRLDLDWFQAGADEFLRVFSSSRGRVAFFSAAREIYLDEPFGERGFWERLRTLSRPALFLWGDRDFLVPAGFARHVEACVPNATSIVLEDCGHVPQFEKPKLTHELVRKFFGC